MRKATRLTVRCPKCQRIIVRLYVLEDKANDLEAALGNIVLACDRCGLEWYDATIGCGEIFAQTKIGEIEEVEAME